MAYGMSPHVLRLSARAAIVSLALTALASSIGCAGTRKPAGSGNGTGNGGSLGSGSGGSGSGTGGRGGSLGSGNGGISGSGSGGSGACQTGEFTFAPKVPSVYLVVDRSGSMFQCLGTQTPNPCADRTNSAWGKFQAAVLPVVQSLQADVRFGFVAFTGTDASHGNMCPMLSQQIDPAQNNYAAIMSAYTSLPFRTDTDKWETPTAQTLKLVGGKLMADTAPGDKYILFVTDGQPDYCDDSNSLCAPDSVVGALQTIKAGGVTTIVMGLLSSINDLPAGTLDAWANAGAGEQTVAPLRTGLDINAFFDQCNGVAGWHADFLATGKPQTRGQTIGQYAPTAGPTKPYRPDIADQTMLVNQISAALAGVKSCTFDLAEVNSTRPIRVDPAQLNKASILIEGQTVPLDDANGWRLVGPSQIELTGSACTNWRLPANTHIVFNFPCEIIVPT